MTDTKSNENIAKVIGESKRTTERIMKRNDLILELRQLVSEGKLGTRRCIKYYSYSVSE